MRFQQIVSSFRSFTVDFLSAGDTLKAVDLSGQEVGGRSVKIEAEAPPAPASPKKAGNPIFRSWWFRLLVHVAMMNGTCPL